MLLLFDYFEDTGNSGQGRRELGGVNHFLNGLWSVYNRIIGDGFPRTNNAVEGWQREFQCTIGFYNVHLPTYKMIKALMFRSTCMCSPELSVELMLA